MRLTLVAFALAFSPAFAAASEAWGVFNDVCAEPMLAGAPPDSSALTAVSADEIGTRAGGDLFLSPDGASVIRTMKQGDLTDCVVTQLDRGPMAAPFPEISANMLDMNFVARPDCLTEGSGGWTIEYFTNNGMVVWVNVNPEGRATQLAYRISESGVDCL
ncbi:MAG: hypothetical protein AAFP28_00495 [Pseudomonadota bacterium]